MQRQGQAWVIVDSARRGSVERLMRKNRLSYASWLTGTQGHGVSRFHRAPVGLGDAAPKASGNLGSEGV